MEQIKHIGNDRDYSVAMETNGKLLDMVCKLEAMVCRYEDARTLSKKLHDKYDTILKLERQIGAIQDGNV